MLAKDKPDLLAFEYRDKRSRPVHSLLELHNAYRDEDSIGGFVHPFNGVLVNRKVIEQVGLPKKEFFIWGDESEYFWRVKRSGIKSATILSAFFLHPIDRMRKKTLSFLGRKIHLPYSEDPIRFALLIRNHSYIYTRHISFFKWLMRTVLYLVFFPHKAPLILSSSLRGALGRFE